MTREEKEKIVKKLLEDNENNETLELLLNQIKEMSDQLRSIIPAMELLTHFFVLQQKDFCEAKGISPDALRSKILSGDIEFLQADGSRLNFIPLKASAELKPRKRK